MAIAALTNLDICIMTWRGDMTLTLASVILLAIQVFQKFLIIKFAVPAVNLGNLFLQVGQIALRKTTHHKEFLNTTFGLGLSKLQNGVDTLFLGIVDKTAGIYHYDFTLRVVAIVCTLIAVGLHQAHQSLAINQIL